MEVEEQSRLSNRGEETRTDTVPTTWDWLLPDPAEIIMIGRLHGALELFIS